MTLEKVISRFKRKEKEENSVRFCERHCKDCKDTVSLELTTTFGG